MGSCMKLVPSTLVNITGDVIALSDDAYKTLIDNWKNNQRAYFDDVSDSQHNHWIQVVFNQTTILVVPAPSITMYVAPPTYPHTPLAGLTVVAQRRPPSHPLPER
ncbi:hypothetical protein EDD85DRAFT_128528 [Armillaria nabsnona]|nr:hypothetical protein EDD85DRAFT_128528 [Armillaria nabsnona]